MKNHIGFVFLMTSLAFGAAGCSSSDYPNVYGNAPGKPLSPGPGGGLWQPNDVRYPNTSSAGYLLTYVPVASAPKAPGNAVDTSNLLTPTQQAQVQAERARSGDEAAEAMKKRLAADRALDKFKLLTPAQQAQVQAARLSGGDDAAEAMKRRLLTDRKLPQ